jgi:hypothetical protein
VRFTKREHMSVIVGTLQLAAESLRSILHATPITETLPASYVRCHIEDAKAHIARAEALLSDFEEAERNDVLVTKVANEMVK